MHLWVWKVFHLVGQASLKYLFLWMWRAGIWLLLYPGQAQYIIVIFMEHIGKKMNTTWSDLPPTNCETDQSNVVDSSPPPTPHSHTPELGKQLRSHVKLERVGWSPWKNLFFLFKTACGSISVCKYTFQTSGVDLSKRWSYDLQWWITTSGKS